MDQQYQTPPSSQPSPVENIPNFSGAPDKSNKVGPIIAILVLIIVIAIVVVYLLSSKVSVNAPAPENLSPVSTESIIAEENQDADLTPQEITPVTNTNDDLDSLQADLDASIDGLDSQNI